MTAIVRICSLLRDDPLRWHLLGVVERLNLPDCWIGAGFVRNAVWDHLHQRRPTPLTTDVDVIWFDPNRAYAAADCIHERCLQAMEPTIRWSVKNQARMHNRNGDDPYRSATEAMRFWPETATAIAARRNQHGDCQIAAPYGVEDLLNLILRPTPRFISEKREVYEERIRSKGWLCSWPMLSRTDG